MGLVVIYLFLHPLSDGLYVTSLWAAKILSDPDSIDSPDAKHMLKINQSALMKGWLSDVPFISSLLFYTSIVLGIFYHWWFGIVVFIAMILLGTLSKMLFTSSVTYYLLQIYTKMANRTADYRAKNDIERAEAGASFCRDLENIMDIYKDSGIKPPSEKQIKTIPYGDIYYLYNSVYDKSSFNP